MRWIDKGWHEKVNSNVVDGGEVVFGEVGCRTCECNSDEQKYLSIPIQHSNKRPAYNKHVHMCGFPPIQIF